MKTGIELIAEERQEQIEKHGFSLVDDAIYYENNEFEKAALYVITCDEKYYPENWGGWFKEKIKAKAQRMNLIEFAIERNRIAGALLAANIDRMLQAIDKTKQS